VHLWRVAVSIASNFFFESLKYFHHVNLCKYDGGIWLWVDSLKDYCHFLGINPIVS